MKGADARTSGRTEGGGGIVCDDHHRCCSSHQGQDLRGQGLDGLCACSTLCPQTWYETACTRWQRRLISWKGICRMWLATKRGREEIKSRREKGAMQKGGKTRGEIPGETELDVCATSRPSYGPVGRWQAGGVADIINISTWFHYSHGLT